VDGLDKNITRQIFRVIQECLTNVVRHAQAQHVSIDLRMHDVEKKLLLKVTDDGQGCDLQSLSRGFGVRGIKERIKSLEGEVLLESEQAAGMRVSAWIPLS
jgi:two-component system sensor histidine kinase UhpB